MTPTYIKHRIISYKYNYFLYFAQKSEVLVT